MLAQARGNESWAERTRRAVSGATLRPRFATFLYTSDSWGRHGERNEVLWKFSDEFKGELLIKF